MPRIGLVPAEFWLSDPAPAWAVGRAPFGREARNVFGLVAPVAVFAASNRCGCHAGQWTSPAGGIRGFAGVAPGKSL